MRILFLKKPSAETVDRYSRGQLGLSFSYPDVGATSATPPAGYVVDQTRIDLGRGASAFEAARQALQRWQHCRLGWVDVWSPTASPQAGHVVAIMGRAVGFWWLNFCRIVYTVDESGPTNRFGFAHGTLPGHIAAGEERFLVEWDRSTDRVSYHILAFSRPNHFLTRLGYPLVRLNQKRFGRDSAASMFHAVNANSTLPNVFQTTS